MKIRFLFLLTEKELFLFHAHVPFDRKGIIHKIGPSPPTSTNCERLFSIAGQAMDEKRANLLPERLDKLLFLPENIKNTNFNFDWYGSAVI